MRVDNTADVSGTFRIGTLKATYRELCELFDEPLSRDDYKISTEWVIRFNGKVYTIYDYKQTSLYSHDLPSVSEFRSDENPKEWHIGGKGNCEAFISEIQERIEKTKQRRHPITLVEISTCEVVASSSVYISKEGNGHGLMLDFLTKNLDCSLVENLVFSVEAGDPVMYVQGKDGKDFQVAINRREEV